MDRPLHNPKSPSSYRRRRIKYGEQAKEKKAAVVSETSEQNAGTPSTESFLARAVKEGSSGGTAKLAGEAKELLDDANGTSANANHAWLAFLALLAFLLVTLGGVSHKDLLLNTPVTLPTIDMQIPLFSLFQFAPMLLVACLLSLLIQHVVLARKYRKFAEAVAPYEKRTQTEHPARELVHSYMVSQLLAGPRRNLALRWLMRLTVFVTVAVLPIVTLLYFQVKFLPYHALWITYWHRIAVLLGLVMLFIALPIMHLRPRNREVKLGPQAEAWQASPYGIVIGVVLATLIVGFSWLIATVPDEQVDLGFVPPTVSTDTADTEELLLNPVVRVVYRSWVLRWLVSNAEDRKQLLRWLLSYRVLVLEDEDMVRDEDDSNGEVSVALRERDLRFARLSRSDLHRADLTKADLSGAKLQDTRLEKANLYEATLQDADLRKAHLQDAKLYWANLQGANLQDAELQGVELGKARLQGAVLPFAQLQGADLLYANLQGADLRQAQLQGADLSGAQLQGADLRFTKLPGARLPGAQLQGADLRGAWLQGADLDNAQLQGADLTKVGIWLASFPDSLLQQSPELPAPIGLPETSPPTPEDWELLKQQLPTSIGDSPLLKRLVVAHDAILRRDAPEWADEGRWERYIDETKVKTKEPSPDALARYLANLACSDSGTAEGLARRAIGYGGNGKGNYAKPLAKALLNLDPSCEGVKGLSADTQEKLRGSASATAGP